MELNKIHNIDCLEFMKTLPDKCIDLIVTDPPYNLDYNGRGKITKHNKFANDALTSEHYKNFVCDIVKEFSRILKNDNAIYVWIDWRNYDIWLNELRKYFNIKNCIVWVKQNFGMGQYFRFQHEFCIFGTRGGNKLATHSESDVWQIKRDVTINYQHATQKPLEAMSKPISYSSKENDIIYDPFAGSGTTGVACKMLGRNYILNEISPEYCKIAEDRIKSISNTLF